jgi:hypothetical protein
LLTVCLPRLLSFDYWIFKDRCAQLNLEYLFFIKHYRLGVDVGYSYGLLPVLIQHLACLAGGLSFKPLIGCTLVVVVVSAVFWAALLMQLPPRREWLFTVAALSPLILPVNPKLPYSLAVLSIQFATLYLLKRRFDIALAIAAVGSLCIPSLPLVLTLLIGLWALADWWSNPDRSLRGLAALFAPAIGIYAALAALLSLVFGFASFSATALPIAGARFYRESGLSKFGAFLAFLHPAHMSTKYYIAYYVASPVTWFVLCSLFLVALAGRTAFLAVKGATPTAAEIVVVLFAVLQSVFVFFAYGVSDQHISFDAVLAAATLIGISTLPAKKARGIALTLFLCLGVLGEAGPAFKTILLWRSTAPQPGTLGLFAASDQAREWSDIVSGSRHGRTLMLGYAAGQHIYYPTIENPDAWFLHTPLLFPSQKQQLLDEIRQADTVVEYLQSWSNIVDADPDIHAAVAEMQMTSATENFRIWRRKPAR